VGHDIDDICEIVHVADKYGFWLTVKLEYKLKIRESDIEELRADCQFSKVPKMAWKTLVRNS
jgi:hypothetical protein